MLAASWVENKKELPHDIWLKDIQYWQDHTPAQTHTLQTKRYYFCGGTCLKIKPQAPCLVTLFSTSPAFMTAALHQAWSLQAADKQWTGQLTSLRISHSKFWMQSNFLLRQRWAAMRFLLRRRTSWMNSNCSEVSLCILTIIWKSFLGRSVIWSTGKGSLTWNQE